MTLPDDISTWLRVIGLILSGLGSLILAWRVKGILDSVVNCLVAHDYSLEAINDVINKGHTKHHLVLRSTVHLLNKLDKFGVITLVLGFASLGLGMLTSAAAFLFRS